MKNIATVSRVKVSADGHGVLSHAGVGMVREIADLTGLSEQVTAVLADTYRGPWSHAPGAVFADLVAAVADGADCIDIAAQATRSRSAVFGPGASSTTMWRLIDERIDAEHLPQIRTARAHARATAWAAGAAPTSEWLYIDVDATITIDHSDGKENAAATWKRTFGMHPLMAYLDRPDIAGGEALAALLRPGNAGSNTTADHITVLAQALQSLPADYRPTPHTAGGPKILVRSDSAGATHGFATACREAGVGFSFGFAVDHRVREAAEHLNATAGWMPAIESDGDIREGAWIAEATDLVPLGSWPAGTRLLLRKERPHPGAQLTFTDSDGHRITAFITDTDARRSVVPGAMAGLELRHRQHARVEDRIRQAKATGLRNLPCHHFAANAAWLEIISAATDLVAWTKLIGFVDEPALARCEIATFRYRVLHVAARITRGAREIRLRIDSSWQWAQQIADAWCRIRCAFT